MPFALAFTFIREIAIIVLVALLLFAVSSCRTQSTAIKHLKTEHELTLVTKEAAYTAKALDMERKANEQVIQAINAAKQREKANAVDANNAIAINERLSQTIDRLSANAATDAAYRVEYAATASQLLKDCSGSITDLARVADMHVNDIRMLQDAAKRK